jgi:hypothetical protein
MNITRRKLFGFGLGAAVAAPAIAKTVVEATSNGALLDMSVEGAGQASGLGLPGTSGQVLMSQGSSADRLCIDSEFVRQYEAELDRLTALMRTDDRTAASLEKDSA